MISTARMILFGLAAKMATCDEPPQASCPLEPPLPQEPASQGAGLDGFDSPYLGHTGSWDGKGGGLGGSSKDADMDLEMAMGLRWTFMPVYWSALEPDGPVDLSEGTPPAWLELDTFVIHARARGLNILMQAPVMGGNAGSPPAWAGLREEGKSAPQEMQAAADFTHKLANRYRPGGTLAEEQGWGETYGVRAWELDNEPNSYKIHWENQAGDYAEFAYRVAGALRAADPGAIVVGPALSWGGNEWLDQALEPSGKHGSPTYVANGVYYSLGPTVDVVSFHVYEGLNHTSIECALSEVLEIFEARQNESGFQYARKLEYWHTEGGYEFIGGTPDDQLANWRWQFMARAFAAGVHKVNIMDPSALEQIAVATFVNVLPDPFPMQKAVLTTSSGEVWAMQHLDGASVEAGQVWILWAENGTGDTIVEVPVEGPWVEVVQVDGSAALEAAEGGILSVPLSGTTEFSQPVMVVDRP